MGFFRNYGLAVLVLLAGLWYYSCSQETPVKAESSVKAGQSPKGISASTQWMSPLAILRPGETPLWFELGREKPELVDSPGDASLKPFEPWPLTRWMTGFLIQEDRLIGTVNRSGFLVFIPAGEEDVALYPVTDAAGWENYTVASLFLYQKTPAVLLYRNDFFEEPLAVPPEPPVRGLAWGLIPGGSKPIGLELPALKSLPAGEGWEADALRLGKDGYWYYRGENRGRDKPVYFRSPDLASPGEPASAGDFRSASEPSPVREAPALLARLLEEAFKLSGPGTIPVAAVTFAESGGTRYFSETPPPAGETGEFVELSGYYRGGGAGFPGDPQGLVLFPGGKGVYGKLREGTIETGGFTLPSLPEKFSYTGIGLTGPALIALWEEREDLNVGAAGFMVIRWKSGPAFL
ncbi:MAG: hypothetical protein LBC60_10130 [Spirochaetaceae bacterium]|jgi:hypothetical protein|nr:hypothetical protein [Spirochaetaceae bacterium]